MIFTHCILKSDLAMEHRPNSRPERTGPFMTYTNIHSRDIGPDEDRDTHSPIRSLGEYFVMKRAIKQLTSSTHPTYNMIDARLDSFTNWLRGSPSPKSLSEAGFFFTGKYKTIFSLFQFFKNFCCHLYPKILTFQEEGMRQFAFAAGWVFTNGYLQAMRGRNTQAGHLIVYSLGTSEAPLLFVRVDGWDPRKIQIGKKILYM